MFDGLTEFFDYKNVLIGDLLSNETIVRLLDDQLEFTENVGALVYKQVFPFEYVPDTVDHSKTFICCEVDIREVVSKTFLLPTLYIWVFTHQSKLQLPTGGVRTDKLSSEIDKIVNGSRYFGLGELNLFSARRFTPISEYQGRVLTYNATDFNRPGTHKFAPANRKRS